MDDVGIPTPGLGARVTVHMLPAKLPRDQKISPGFRRNTGPGIPVKKRVYADVPPMYLRHADCS